jgi:hypothetical protein
MLHSRNLIVVLVLFITGGCGATVRPPAQPPRAVHVYITDYGRHSSLLMPTRDGHLVEFAFGDFDWFALNQTQWYDGPRSLLFSRGSTLGRRELRDIDDAQQLARATGAAKVTRFDVDGDRAARLRDDLNFAYSQHSFTEVFNPASDLYFVRVPECYGLFHNCNQVTARWLRDLGCEVTGPAITSNFTVSGNQSTTRKEVQTQPSTQP